MSLADIYAPGRFGLSFELFPPKREAGLATLSGHVCRLMEFQPSFITCTYGAGGSTRDKTLRVVDLVKRQFQVPVASHLTCVGSNVDQLREFLREADGKGVDHIVALRGDPPQGETSFRPVPGGLRYANELVQLIRSEFPAFGVAVAGYPETHREASSPHVDLENLKRKVETGASAVITQLFYDNRVFFDFRERFERSGIQVPLVPGILPVTNLRQIRRITSLCGATLPDDFVAALSKHDDEEGQFQAGVQQATEQVQELIESGPPGIHFYVLNRSKATSTVLRELNLSGK